MTSDGFFFTFYYKDTTLALTEMLRQRWETAFATSWPINYFNQFKELKLGTKNKRLVEERDFFSFRLCTKKLHMSDNRLFLKRRKRTWVAIQLREFGDWEEWRLWRCHRRAASHVTNRDASGLTWTAARTWTSAWVRRSRWTWSRAPTWNLMTSRAADTCNLNKK